jgi:hypothetical protein
VPGDRREQILDQHRHTGERGVRIGPLLACVVVERAHDRVEARVDRLGARDRGLEYLAGGDRAGPDQIGERRAVAASVLVVPHHFARSGISGGTLKKALRSGSL